MNREEITALLGLMAARDGRTIGRIEVEAWLEDVGRLDFATAREAVHRHYVRSRDFMRPVDLVNAVREVREERLVGVDAIVPAADPDDTAAYLAELRRIRGEVAAGRLQPPPRAEIGPTGIDPEVARIIEGVRLGIAADRADQARAAAEAKAAEEAERARQLAAIEAMPATPEE